MPKLESLYLRCNDPETQRDFYCDVLGMNVDNDGSVGYQNQEARIHFLSAQNRYESQPNDTYWKIALAVPCIELACRQLAEQSIHVGEPFQFQDIGYLAHFNDPAGFSIELIDHRFQGNRPDEPINHGLFGGGAHFNLLTLRTTNIDNVRQFCQNAGMTTLAIEPVESHGFMLYFFAYTTDVPPSSDLYCVENREWLYQRKYTVLEVQHVLNETEVTLPVDGQPGYAGTVISGFPEKIPNNILLINSVD